jgi:hypothetical protein
MHLTPSARQLTGSRSSAFPRKITAKERGEVQKLPYIGSKVSKMVGCARLIPYPFLYSHQADRRIPLPWLYPRSWYVLYVSPTLHTRSKWGASSQRQRESQNASRLSRCSTPSMASDRPQHEHCMTADCVPCATSKLTTKSTPALRRQRTAKVQIWTFVSRLDCAPTLCGRANPLPGLKPKPSC